MAGLTCGIIAAKNGINVTVCEQNPRVGKKISQTGNGKCNIGNLYVSPKCFNDSEIARRVCEKISVEEYRGFLESCGIYTFADSFGRLYPLNESASNVVDCLRYCLEKHGGKFLLNERVLSVGTSSGGFTVETSSCRFNADKVILACGSGSSAPAPKIDGIVPKAWFTPLCPSLVPLKVVGMDKSLNGLRAKAEVLLLSDGKEVARETGEIQFRDFGLSGICVMNLSAQITRRKVLGEKHCYSVVADVVPNLSEYDLEKILLSRADFDSDKLFYGILHNTLARYVLKKASEGMPDFAPAPDKSLSATGERFGVLVSRLANTAKNLSFDVNLPADFSQSQVTAGGISEKFVDPETLSLPNGIVALGEVLNVDGICGGNNLYFAAASALSVFTPEQRKKATCK